MTWDGVERRKPIAIGVMCKAPRPGVSKTRLAQTTGADMAARLAGAFIRDVFHTISTAQLLSPIVPFAFYAPANARSEISALVPPTTRLHLQEGTDLGIVMFDALQAMLAICPAGAVLIGSDIPTLPSEILLQAMSSLRMHGERVVFGPSFDGGYYLIGIKTASAAPLFAPMAWSGPLVMEETRSRARLHGLQQVDVEPWYDVDDAVGLVKLKATLAVTAVDVAPATRAVLASV